MLGPMPLAALTEGWVDYLNGPWGFAFAFAAGLLSFLSPCVLPLVPAYLAHLTGTTATLDGSTARRSTIAHAAAFVLGFTAVFTLLGISVGALSAIVSSDNAYFFQNHQNVLDQIGGIVLIILGVNLIGIIRIPVLYRTYTLEPAMSSAGATTGGGRSDAGAGGATAVAIGGPPHPPVWLRTMEYGKSFGVGSAFAVGWTPCIGPVLGAILTLSATTGSVAKGGYLLLVYSLGLGVPFIITGLAVVPITAFFRRIRGLMPVVEVVTGVMVIAVGVLLFQHNLSYFNDWFSNIPFLDRLNQI
jgi:cytochrome c-type biogenesis protein